MSERAVADLRRSPGPLARLSDAADRVTVALAATCLIAMLVIVMLQVVARYIFDAPPAWTEEGARYMMVWSGLLGAAVAFKRRLDPVLFQWRPEGPNWLLKAMTLLQSVAVLGFIVPVLYTCFVGPGGDPARSFMARQMKVTADTFGFSMVWVASAVPLMGLLILLHLFGGRAPMADDEPAID
ncbi:MAG: TRAP transporter small permease subunit [Burkholderiaceae bacterium]